MCHLLSLTNDGTVKASGGKTGGAYSSSGIRSISGENVSTISGTGRLLCMGSTGITVYKPTTAPTVPQNRGRDRGCVGQSYCGVDTGDSGTVKVESGASLAAVGARDGIDGSVSGGGTVFHSLPRWARISARRTS